MDTIAGLFQQLTEKISHDPTDVSTLIKLGRLSFEPMHKFADAVSFFQRALLIDPQNVEARFWLAKCLYHSYCNYADARRLLEESLAINPNSPECLSLLASVLDDLDEPKERSIELLKRAVELAPDWVTPRENLAMWLLEVGNAEEAKIVATQGLEKLQPRGVLGDPLEQYYESAVTGRAWPSNREDLESLLDRIRPKGIEVGLSNRNDSGDRRENSNP